MRNGLVWLSLVAMLRTQWGFGAQDGKQDKPETLVRWHFAGTKQIAVSKEFKALREIVALPESQAFRDSAVATLAMKAGSHFTEAGSTNANPAAVGLIKGLLPDLLQNESRVELSAKGTENASWILAIRLPQDRLESWSKNLVDLARLARMEVKGEAGSRTWSAGREDYHFAFAEQKEWVVLEGGFSKGPVDPKTFKEFRGGLGKKADKAILDAQVNFPLLGAIWNSPQFSHYPKVSWRVLPHQDGVRSEGYIDYPQPLDITPEKWNVPVDIIRDPLIGFTALQGIRAKLGESEGFKRLGAKKTPNQFFLWSQDNGPFAVFIAADVGNPEDVVKTIGTKVLPGLKESPGGRIEISTNRSLVLWRGLPIVVPFFEQAADPDGSFLEAGLFPVASTNKPPRELFEQLNRKNLVYYDWEITQARLGQWRPIWQLARMAQDKPFEGGASDPWLQAIAPKLGNTVTEATLEGANRLKFVRQSDSGFSALELVLLGRWLDGDQPARAPRPRAPQAQPTTGRPKRPTPAPAARPVTGPPTQ
ncbi:MAG TPA: hypothetical protein VGR78_04380 [Verrucomicrobiae bacterium]|nr:hypothetical protein [Verrucomicrobiae bacterium]